MISISTKTFDPQGLIQLKPEPADDDLDLPRRVNRTATLDEGATFDDMGFSWSDVTRDLRFENMLQADADQLGYICRNYGEVIYTDKHGAFSALVESVVFEKGGATLKLLLLGEA